MKPIIIDGSDPESLGAYMLRHLEALGMNNYSESTLRARRPDLSKFNDWCVERGLNTPQEITRPIIEQYQKHIYYLRKKNGKPLSNQRQMHMLVAVRVFFQWMAKKNYLLYNPSSEIELPRKERRLPQSVLNHHEVERIMNQPDIRTPYGIRDRAMLEVMYSTGMRRSEMIKLKLDNVDYERETLFISQGKGKTDRVVPIGERALKWLEKYLNEVRPKLANEFSGKHIFISYQGKPLSAERLSINFREYKRAANIDKEGACHMFRHSMATNMLENGADVRFIQEILGHRKLETTQRYTRVSIKKLKEVHTKTHPAAKLNP